MLLLCKTQMCLARVKYYVFLLLGKWACICFLLACRSDELCCVFYVNTLPLILLLWSYNKLKTNSRAHLRKQLEWIAVQLLVGRKTKQRRFTLLNGWWNILSFFSDKKICIKEVLISKCLVYFSFMIALYNQSGRPQWSSMVLACSIILFLFLH